MRNELDRQQKASRNAPEGQALDIEELVADGARRGVCAYYGARHSLKEADLIFAPYNFVVDECVRERGSKMGELLRGALLIFDEAHNVEDAAREAGSVDLPMREMATLALLIRRPGLR